MIIAIALGAMGAHYLKETIALPVDKLDSWKTGVLYQLIHSLSVFVVILLATVVILVVSLLSVNRPTTNIAIA